MTTIAKVARKSNRGSAPGEHRGGRVKGVPNKLTASIKSMVTEALEKAGGVDYLVKQAKETPGPFMALVGKLLPMQVSGDIVHHVARMPAVAQDKEEWLKLYSPKSLPKK